MFLTFAFGIIVLLTGMQPLSDSLILLNGEPKTPQIDSIVQFNAQVYRVYFKNNPKYYYTYTLEKVVWFSNPKRLSPELHRVYHRDVLQSDVAEILRFEKFGVVYWRIKYKRGREIECPDGEVKVLASCLDNKMAKNVFAYVRSIAAINPLGKENSQGILSKIYETIDFIDDRAAVAGYLNPKEYPIKSLKHKGLIYPFGLNASQKKAVERAFEHQISIVQGPPGTGKTQTILNVIANIVRMGKTIMVVSNNNSATVNIQEKLERYGFSFIVAGLGSNENKVKFILNQPSVPVDLYSWKSPHEECSRREKELHAALQKLDTVFALQNEQAELRQQQKAIALEWKHFCRKYDIEEEASVERVINSSRLMRLWLQCQLVSKEDAHITNKFSATFKRRMKRLWLYIECRYLLRLQHKFSEDSLVPLEFELQKLYYQNYRREIDFRLNEIAKELALYDAKDLMEMVSEESMTLFRASLYDKYQKSVRGQFSIETLETSGSSFLEQYPVVLSTAFSARNNLFGDVLYDYVIMDEASQISIDTAVLALSCAKNALIVGDALQLPNVVTAEDQEMMDIVTKEYKVPFGYDCAKNSFLQSICSVMEEIPQTLLREHYRCHPRIINFCNQKFYGGNLIIMTEDKGEPDVLCAFRTVKGNHAVDHYNQREIDVVKHEVLPALNDFKSIGIISPYNRQVDEFLDQIPNVETATVHKYQGREKDAIIMSVVDNEITSFADDPNLLNVAVSRAKKKFCLIVTGNEQSAHRNILDLLDYISYNNCTITESKVASIFDNLYEQYTKQRIEFLKSQSQISKYASENLTYSAICKVVGSNDRFSYLKVLCHVPLRQIIEDTSLMTPEELRYAGNYSTHVDFLLVHRATKKPFLVIETDGYSYHNDATSQRKRDELKDHILQCYMIPLLRLSTKGSREEERIEEKLIEIQEQSMCS